MKPTKKVYSSMIRSVAFTLLVSFVAQVVFPVTSYALTSGPTTPEVESFAPINATDMVDPFTGDFSYNLPLFELPGPNGGYPFNLIYNAGISMDQEASWVGLGWNLNPGAITRQMRGIPDEWDGSQSITKEMELTPNWTATASVGISTEVFGADLKKLARLKEGLSIRYNSSKGIGYTIDGSIASTHGNENFWASNASIKGTLDSEEGLGVNPSLSLQSKGQNPEHEFAVGMRYSSKAGLGDLVLDMKSRIKYKQKDKNTKETVDKSWGMAGQSNLSFFGGGYTPRMEMNMQGRNISLDLAIGLANGGTYPKLYLKGGFSTSYLGEHSSTKPAYGYLHLDKTYGIDNALLDFNREKDGMIRKNSPNLPIPSTTFDIYSINGHGVGGMYRAYRNDMTMLSDPAVESVQVGGSGGGEFGLAAGLHTGASIAINYSRSESGKWSKGNALFDYLKNPLIAQTPDYERTYLKAAGEHTIHSDQQSAFMQNLEPVRPNVVRVKDGLTHSYDLERKSDGEEISQPAAGGRELRNTLIHPIKGVKDGTSGYYVLNADGSRYLYGQPAYNTKQIECLFNVTNQSLCTNKVAIEQRDGSKYADGQPSHTNGVEKYLSRTIFGKDNQPDRYAYAYLLTSILGADYVDVNLNGVPDDGDYGYWIKFNYEKKGYAENSTSNGALLNYKWRAPFYGAAYDPGHANDQRDGKGSYLYGEKELYFLSSAESRTHVANFFITPRWDARGAGREIQNENTANEKDFAYQYKLDKIELQAKSNPGKALKTIHFQYSHLLCQNVPNNVAAGRLNNAYTVDFVNGKFVPAAVPDGEVSGKLTLKKVYVTYENNVRGALSPYEFFYGENQEYDDQKVDRWGNYKSEVTTGSNCRMSYVSQSAPGLTSEEFNQKKVKESTSWNLKSVSLPTGGTFKIDYESDDYAYVQNKRAMQMCKIMRVNENLGDPYTIDNPRFSSPFNRKVYFRLDKPVPAADIAAEVAKYDDGTKRVYFNIFINLLKGISGERLTGYADVEEYGYDKNCKVSDVSELYDKGYVALSSVNGYHPFSAAAWQHIRTDQPHLMAMGNTGSTLNTGSKIGAIAVFVKGLATMAASVVSTFSGYRSFCSSQGWGKSLNGEFDSYIRLNNPSRKKYGGGHRVRKLELSDNWNAAGASEKAASYGQIYEYTTTEGKNEVISSGVAAYEPMVGGDENPLRYAKEYKESIPLKTDNNLYFEYPVNESYYPAPQVGYSKVTVRSLASYYSEHRTDPENTTLQIPEGILASGAVVHEFYTAKDFPVIAKETPSDNYFNKLPIPIPMIGDITLTNLTCSQGYSVEVNDMHGKPKKISNYAQDKAGKLLPTAASWVQYNYKTSQPGKNDPQGEYLVLNNQVDILEPVSGNRVRKVSKNMGVQFEYFTDMRQSKTKSTEGGLDANFDVPIIIFGAGMPTLWPNFSMGTTVVRTAVTNKIIQRSGIMTGMESFQDGSHVITEHKYFDGQTGQPLLTTISNNDDLPIYDYTVPGHSVYPGMGAAYKNVGITFSGTLAAANAALTYNLSTSGMDAFLSSGDELKYGDATVTVLQKLSSDSWLIKAGYALPVSTSLEFEIIRSGRRNLLQVPAGNVKALSDPVDKLKIN